jgi:hypothetical protein
MPLSWKQLSSSTVGAVEWCGLAEMDTTDFGRIQYLTPALFLSETPPRWDLPPARQGAHTAEWLPR